MFRKWKTLTILGVITMGTQIIGTSYAETKGIYISQNTALNDSRMDYLIRQSKAHGINTFVVDIKTTGSKAYERNMAKLKKQGIRYVARVVMFNGGGTHAQVTDKRIWADRLRLANYAVRHGAQEVQLDYIRYNVHTGASKDKPYFINQVIKYFRTNLPTNIKLQIDIFGVAADKPNNTIGQNAQIQAKHVNTIAPMVYPSHYEPNKIHAKKPYKTVLTSTEALKHQLKNYPNVAVVPWLETYNYRNKMSYPERISYTRAQIQAARDAGAKGYYIWSAQNRYHVLWDVLAE